ncbi:MAG: FGGY family carbohydrate kinase [Candidatus Heimdallarchaeota archaeon]
MELPLLVSMDLGTSAFRLTVFDSQGTPIFSNTANITNQTISTWVEALSCISPRIKTANVPSNNIHVSVCGTSGTVVPVDEFGNPIMEPIMYFERAPPAEVANICALDAAKELGEKGVPISATSPLTKLIHRKKRNPSMFHRVRWILSPTSWLLYRLRFPEGQRWDNVAMDWTNGLKFGVDITFEPPIWFRPIFEQSGFPLELMPDLQSCGSPIGTAQSQLANKLGLSGANLYHGMTDGTATALMTGCLQPGSMGLSVGSTSTLKYACQEIRASPAIYYHKHPLGGYLASAAPVTGAMLRWFSEKILQKSLEDALALAEQIKPGSEFHYLPQGDREPFFASRMGAAFLGLWPRNISSETAQGIFMRSIMLGIALAEYTLIRIIEELFECSINTIGITGGGTRNATWNRIRAAVYEKTLKIIDNPMTLGPLIPVLLNIGLYKDINELEKKLLQCREVILPDKRLVNKYKNRKQSFMNKWSLLKQLHDS